MHDHITAAADDFRRHTRGGGGWALGLAVAACVDVGADNGRPPANRRDRDGSVKVSAKEFGRRAGTSADRVLRYVDAWGRAAAEGVVPPADTLTPDQWHDAALLPDAMAWSDFYTAAAGAGRNVSDPAARERLTAAAQEAGVGVTKVLDVASNPNAVAAALAGDPDFSARVMEKIPFGVRTRVSDQFRAAGPHLAPATPEEKQEWIEAGRQGAIDRQNRQSIFFRHNKVSGALGDAMRSLRRAIDECGDVEWPDQELEELVHSIARVRALLGLVEARITGQTEVDWDAELARLTREEQEPS